MKKWHSRQRKATWIVSRTNVEDRRREPHSIFFFRPVRSHQEENLNIRFICDWKCADLTIFCDVSAIV
ncbi:MAG: hypothetical protein B6245_02820 [Desulfobacteraceae bacterium 4572_88]|nr:MAG: hypothetical protein B6245_02820 [Desulfobacteraceae bacterium 4572_88]